MRHLLALLSLCTLIVFVSCDSSAAPEPPIMETPFIVGDLENESADYFVIDQLIELPKTTTSIERVIDINGDGTDDFRITAIADGDARTQEIRMLPLIGGLAVSKSDIGPYKGEETSMVSTQLEGTEFVADDIDFSTGDLLFASRSKNTALLPYSLSFDRAFIPMLVDGRESWLSFQIKREEADISVLATIEFFTFSQNMQ